MKITLINHLDRYVTIKLPDEFITLCRQDSVTPETVLRGFIADVCGIMYLIGTPRSDGYVSHSADACEMARDYYERVGYPWWNK